MSWVVDHLADLRSDFSVFHRIDDIEQMNSVRFFEFCYRITAYHGGVMATRQASRVAAPAVVEEVAAPVAQVAPDGTVLLPGPPSPLTGGKVVESTPGALALSDIGDMFSFATV